jgi:transmembrane sensor
MESPQQADLIEIGTKIREALDGAGESAGHIRAARAGLLGRVAAGSDGRAARRSRSALVTGEARGRRRIVFLSAALAAGTAALVVWMRLPISFRVGAAGVPGSIGDVVEASGMDPVPVTFSEGSSVTLDSGGRVRVLAAEGAGARVLIEKGSVDASIVHRQLRKTRWSFEAGPFKVLVTGTRFRVDWNPGDQSFGLRTSEGSVVVSGPCLPQPRTVRGGDQLKVSCSPRVEAAQGPRASMAETPAAAPVSSGRSAHLTPGSPAGSWRDWQDLIADGRFAEGLRAAERADFGRVCRTANEKQLLALADAARLSGHTARATEALLILRQRFPNGRSAGTAAFALGRIAYERRGAYAEAARWFRTYVDEQPKGPLMGDAVGRLMESRRRAGDMVGAREDAERYLGRFSDGPYAGAARAILAE